VPELLPAVGTAAAGDGYWEARTLVASAGIEMPRARLVHSWEEARSAAQELGFPLVLKALGRTHKSEGGGVRLGISSVAELEADFSDLAARLQAPAYSLERMASLATGVELIVGVRRDRSFGPVALIGLGGVFAELLSDVAVALAPVSAQQAEDLLLSLRGAPLLTGARDRPPLDVSAAATAAAALSELAAARPDLTEVEVNPLLLGVSGAVALDARCNWSPAQPT
jgi:succinyl-CoA synthetase beta subunit